MQIRIGEALEQGISTMLKNPITLIPLAVAGVINFFMGRYISSAVYKMLSPMMEQLQPFNNVGAQTLPDNVSSSFDPALAQQFAGDFFSLWTSIAPIVIVGGLVMLILYLMSVRLTADAIMETPSPKEALMMSLKKCIPVVLSYILFVAMVGAGSILLLIPGIFLAVRFCYFPFATMLDDKGIISSLSKSWEITKGNFWRTFSLGLVITVLGIGISLLFAVLAPTNPLALASGQMPALPQILQNIAGVIVAALVVGTFTKAYLQARE